MDSTCIIVLLVVININITLNVCLLSKVLNKLKDIDNRISLIQFHSYGNTRRED